MSAESAGRNLGVKVEYLTRVEGHGNIVVEVRDGAVEACRFDVVEAPRGTLFHRYATDAAGLIAAADCVIPTNQNLANIEADLRALVPRILHESDAQIRLRLEMLVRSYDPCISCSTHLVRV